jgi:tRNA(Leu) C34 or U34 (ribose-2'-O)-methylase TrmL
MGETRGYFGMAAYGPKTTDNVGTLWRSAHAFGAAFLAVVAGRYRRQPSDVWNSTAHVPLHTYDTFEQFYANLPHGCQLIGVELCDDACSLPGYTHPERGVYLLGPEDGSLSAPVLKRCHSRLLIPSTRCLNLAVAGSIIAYDRIAKHERRASLLVEETPNE